MTNDLRTRIKAGELLIGTFIKTPAPQNVEILGLAGLDFAVVDQEHAPIGIARMDMMALASRAAGLPILSRRWGASRDWIAPLLDLGLNGVMVPHVMDAADAHAVCDAVRFSRGKRGLSPSPRAGNYSGMNIPTYREHSDAHSVVMVQIEDASALEHLDDIAAAAAAGDKVAAKAGWTRAKDYLNGYLKIVNMPINAKVGDRFGLVEVSV